MNILIRLLLFFSLCSGSAFAQTAGLLPPAVSQFFDNNGNPLASGTVTTYVVGTTTLKTTWQDAAETIPNTNPIVLNAAGRAIIYGDGNYRQVVRDRLGNIIWDAVTSAFGTGGTSQIGDGNAVGTVLPWSGLVAPTRYVFAYGQELSRTTYSQLYTTITLNTTISCASGSPIITGFSDTTQIPIGANVEASCLAAGTTVLSKTSSTITVSNNANVTSSVSLRVFPWGNGNGTTTFNVPDLRGRYLAGRDNMGGTAASRLTNVYYGESADALGANGGFQYNFLATTNLPAYTPAGTIVVTDTHKHFIAANEDINTGTPTNSNASSQIPSRNTFAANVGFNLSNTGTAATVGLTSVTGAGSITSAFTGTAQGGVATPFAIIPPSLTFNYIIKILPDVTISTLNVVTSIQGMVGDLTCVAPVSCTGQVISATGAGSGTVIGPSPTVVGDLVTWNSLDGTVTDDFPYIEPGMAYTNPNANAPYNYIVGVPVSSGVSLPANEYGNVRYSCYAGSSCIHYGNAFQWLSTDPSMTTERTVSNAVNNGSGLIQVTLNSTSGLSNGDPITISLVGGVPNSKGLWAARNVTGTTVDLGGWNGGADSVFAGTFTTTGIRNGAVTTAGTGGKSGVYTNVAVTGGSGTGATANVTVLSGSVHSLYIVNSGTGYTVSDVISVASASIGNTTGFTWTVSSLSVAGYATYGQLDAPIYHLLDVVVPGRTPLFNDSVGFYGWQSQSTTGGVTSNAPVPLAKIDSYIVDPNTAQTGAQGKITFGVASNFAGGKNIGNVMTLGQGIIATGCDGSFPNGATPTTSAGWIAQDFGHATVNALAYYAGSLSLPVPRVGDGNNVILFKASATTARVTADSLTAQGPLTGVACGKANVTLFTTLRTIDKTVNFATNGAGGLDINSIASNTPYAIFIIAKSSDGTVNILASLSATAPTMPTGYDIKAFVGFVETAPGAATLLDNVQAGSLQNGRPFFVITGAVTINSTNASAYQNSTIIAGGASSYTVTVGTTSGFANGAELVITNGDTAFNKPLVVSGLPSIVIPPKASAVIKNINNAWFYIQTNFVSTQDSNQTTIVGQTTAAANTTASIFATAVGYQALNALTTGIENSAFGYGALQTNTTGASNTAIGLAALFLNTTGSNNVAVGRSALGANTTASNNMAIGFFALGSNTTSGGNTAIGTQALNSSVTGSENTAIGTLSLFTANGASDNTAIGYQSLTAVTSGITNTAIGARSGISLTSGSNNIVIGYNLNLASNTASNQLNIGDLIWGVGLSGSNAGCIAIGATSCTNKLEITGAVRTVPVAVASLPTCNAGAEGSRHAVNDSNAASFTAGIGAVVAAGGTTHVPVYCDGTNWRIG